MEHGGTAMADAFAAEVVFDRWLGRVVHRLRASRVATLNQFWVLLLVDIHHDVSIRSVADRLEISYTAPRGFPSPPKAGGSQRALIGS